MNKTLITTITTAMIMGTVSTTFAAADPFSDVPKDNWAYGAVTKLSQDGILEGYGDGSFRGNQTITRYEMAQIVANAMTKQAQASEEDKAVIEKLSKEYQDELVSLGARVGKLEAKQPNVALNGEIRIRSTSGSYDNGKKASSVNSDYRLRLNATAKVDNNTTAAFRLVNREPDINKFNTSTSQTFGGNGQSNANNNTAIDRVYLTSDLGNNTSVVVGRQPFIVDKNGMLVDSGALSYDGISFGAKAGQYNLSASYGRFIKGATYDGGSWGATALFGNLDVTGIGISTTQKNITYGISYFDLVNSHADINASLNPQGADTHIKWTIANVNYLLNPKLSVGMQYAHNGGTAMNPQGSANGNDSNMWSVNTVIGTQKLVKRGDSNVSLTYVDAKASSMLGALSNLPIVIKDQAADFKEYFIDYNYAFSKNYTATLEYAKLVSPADTVAKPEDQHQYRFWLTAKF